MQSYTTVINLATNIPSFDFHDQYHGIPALDIDTVKFRLRDKGFITLKYVQFTTELVADIFREISVELKQFIKSFLVSPKNVMIAGGFISEYFWYKLLAGNGFPYYFSNTDIDIYQLDYNEGEQRFTDEIVPLVKESIVSKNCINYKIRGEYITTSHEPLRFLMANCYDSQIQYITKFTNKLPQEIIDTFHYGIGKPYFYEGKIHTNKSQIWNTIKREVVVQKGEQMPFWKAVSWLHKGYDIIGKINPDTSRENYKHY